MPKLSDKVDRFSESMIRQMTILSNKYNAINLAQGFKEFDPWQIHEHSTFSTQKFSFKKNMPFQHTLYEVL